MKLYKYNIYKNGILQYSVILDPDTLNQLDLKEYTVECVEEYQPEKQEDKDGDLQTV